MSLNVLLLSEVRRADAKRFRWARTCGASAVTKPHFPEGEPGLAPGGADEQLLSAENSAELKQIQAMDGALTEDLFESLF